MAFAMDLKLRGNDCYKNQEYDLAVHEYERCLSLFEWVDPLDKDWKTKVL
jgi:hypothetical protein